MDLKIQRYSVSGKDPNGNYVLFDDHKRIVESLLEEINIFQKIIDVGAGKHPSKEEAVSQFHFIKARSKR